MTGTWPPLDAAGTEAFDILARARAERRPCPPVRTILPPGDIDAAYAVQSAWVAGRLAAGDRVIGRKIGLTNAAVQAHRRGQRVGRTVHAWRRPPAAGRPADST